MIAQLRPALVLVALFTVLTGLALPVRLRRRRQRLCFPYQAGGSLIERDGKVVGSALLGQIFTQDRYFHGRPSATTDTDPADSTKTVPAPYNAGNSSGSNARADLEGADRPGHRATSPTPAQAGAGRRGDDLGLRPRPGHLARERRPAGRTGRRCAQAAGGRRCRQLVAAIPAERLLGPDRRAAGERARDLNLALDAASKP